MATLDRNEIGTRIKLEIQKTKKQVEEYKELTRPVEPENAIGRISRMDAINNKSVIETNMANQSSDLCQKIKVEAPAKNKMVTALSTMEYPVKNLTERPN